MQSPYLASIAVLQIHTNGAKQNSIISIPKILHPYFLAILPKSDCIAWFYKFYEEELKSYVNNLVDEKLFGKQGYFSNKNIKLTAMQQILVLQSYFTKKELNFANHQEYCAIIRQDLKQIDDLIWKLENRFYQAILQQQQGFNLDSFLPKNLRNQLQQIIKIQLLININDMILLQSKNDSSSTSLKAKQLLEIQQWLKKELSQKTFSIVNHNFREQFYNLDKNDIYQPNMLWYFCNGAKRLPMFLQMEYVKFKSITNEYWQWITDLALHKISLRKSVILLPLAALTFVYDLLFVCLLPYRLTRTLVNEMYATIENKVENYTKANQNLAQANHSSSIISFTWKSLLYCSLLVSFSLAILPLPLYWIPLIFYNPVIAYLGAGYLASIILFSGLYRMCQDISGSNSESIVQENRNDFTSNETTVPAIKQELEFDKTYCPLKSRYQNNTATNDGEQLAAQKSGVRLGSA